jgi:Mechanosensitive ion channel
MKTSAMIAALGMLIALPVAAQEMFFYPSQGQSPEQQNTDQGECHAWAVHQTGFDPANPPAPAAAAPAPTPQGGLLTGAARGALIAGAGVVGLAVGFGAQTLVKDLISGMFFLLDDAFRVGAYIISGSYKGTVQSFSLRSIKLRHHRG